MAHHYIHYIYIGVRLDSNEFPRVDVILDGLQPFWDVQITLWYLVTSMSECWRAQLDSLVGKNPHAQYNMRICLKRHADRPGPLRRNTLRVRERLTGRRNCRNVSSRIVVLLIEEAQLINWGWKRCTLVATCILKRLPIQDAAKSLRTGRWISRVPNFDSFRFIFLPCCCISCRK